MSLIYRLPEIPYPSTPELLSERIETPLDDLTELAATIHTHYKKNSEEKKDKYGNPRMYKGKVEYRIYYAPSEKVKRVLKLIKSKIIDTIPLPPGIHGIKDAGSIENAKIHQGKKFHFVTDLRNFFPSISATSVYKALRAQGFAPDVARLLRDLTTLHGFVPQGAPTSSHIANVVFLRTDLKLIDLSKEHNLIYTRYVDDLTFSSLTDFKDQVPNIKRIVQDDGFTINHKKTGYKIGPVVVTGPKSKQNLLSPSDSQISRRSDPSNSEERNKGIDDYFSQVRNTNKSKRKKRKAKAIS